MHLVFSPIEAFLLLEQLQATFVLWGWVLGLLPPQLAMPLPGQLSQTFGPARRLSRLVDELFPCCR